ncbi:MAG: hypothetical protein ACRBDI_08135 [Alphaproteobacteria bacterium]
MMNMKFILIVAILSVPLTGCMSTTASKDKLRMERLGFSAYDLNADTYVTEDEIESCYLKSFNSMDKNSDGFIDSEEDKSAMSNYFVRFRSSGPRKCEDAFQVMQVGRGQYAGLVENFDKNKDGVLSKSEFLSLRTKSKLYFLSHDLNSDSKITESEALDSIKSQMPKLKF